MLVSILLMIASFLVPPTGVIDGSVLMGIGEIGAMAAILSFLGNLPEYLRAGAKAKISKGDLGIEFNGGKEEEIEDGE